MRAQFARGSGSFEWHASTAGQQLSMRVEAGPGLAMHHRSVCARTAHLYRRYIQLRMSMSAISEMTIFLSSSEKKSSTRYMRPWASQAGQVARESQRIKKMQ